MSGMSPDRFRALIDAYGASPERWPEAERDAARRFMAYEPRTRQWLNEAAELDGMLDRLKTPQLDEGTQRAVARAMEQAPGTDAVVVKLPHRARHFPMAMAAGLGLAACLAGAWLGVNYSLSSLSDARAQTVLEQVAMVDTDN